MPETGAPTQAEVANGSKESQGPGGRNPDEVALDLMKFIAVTTGYGKGAQSSAGFSGKPGARSPEEYADALLELFQRCRKVVKEA